MVMEMGAPRRDENGAIIEDEFSLMPVVLQYLRRTWKELTFYEKVMKNNSFMLCQLKQITLVLSIRVSLTKYFILLSISPDDQRTISGKVAA